MTVDRDVEQSTSSAGFVFGCIAGPILVVSSVAWLVTRGRQMNDAYAFAPRPPYPWAVLAWRSTVAIFFIVTMSIEFSTSDVEDVWDLWWFTNWNLVLIAFYFVVAAASTAATIAAAPEDVPEVRARFVPPSERNCMERTFSHGLQQPRPAQVLEGTRKASGPSRCMRWLMIAEHTIGELEVPTAVLVSLVIWAYVAPERGFDNYLGFTSVASHLMNAVLMMADFLLAAGWLINGAHFALIVLWPALYLCAHLAGNAAYGVMAYNFMRTDDPWFIAYMIVLLVICVVVFALAHGISRAKQRCFKRYNTEGEAGARYCCSDQASQGRDGHSNLSSDDESAGGTPKEDNDAGDDDRKRLVQV